MKIRKNMLENAKFGNDEILSAFPASSTFGSKGVMIFLEKTL
jgi:hypothetical protein